MRLFDGARSSTHSESKHWFASEPTNRLARRKMPLDAQKAQAYRLTSCRTPNREIRSMNAVTKTSTRELVNRRNVSLVTPTDLNSTAVQDIAATLTATLADVYALHLKTKNFHWHMSGPHFRDYHLMFDEQAAQLFAMTDPLAERCRKIGGATLRSIGQISRTQRVLDNDAQYVDPPDMLAELRDDNRMLAGHLRQAHELCNEHHDIASASLLETWIDQTEQRTWFLLEARRGGDSSGRITLAT